MIKIDWESKRDDLLKHLEESCSYEEIGRMYGVTGNAVKKALLRLGIELKPRRSINKSEHFNKGTGKIKTCINCGKNFTSHINESKFCSRECFFEYQNNEFIRRWKNNEYVGNPEKISVTIRRYLLNKVQNKCEICGFSGVNKLSGLSILQIHHIDGDASNNKEENLQVVCPNCHAMTETFGTTNGHKSVRRRYGGGPKNVNIV